MKKMLSMLSTMSIAIIPMVSVVACGDELETQQPERLRFDLDFLNDQNHSIYSLLALPIWDNNTNSGYGFYPSEWDPTIGTLKDDGMYSWMFDGSAESYVNNSVVNFIQDFTYTNNEGITTNPYKNITSDNINVEWNYDTTAGIYKETITPSDTENAQNLLTGSCEFYINNFAPIDLSKLGDNGVITIPGEGIFDSKISAENINLQTSRKISDAIYNHFTDEKFFNNNNLSMYNGYFGKDNLSQDPNGYYFASSFSTNGGDDYPYSYDDLEKSLILIPIAKNWNDLNEETWQADIINKQITFTIEANYNNPNIEHQSPHDPTVIGSCTFIIDYSDVQ
ncbi:hypothetical protein [Spiroplasma endosymbiont of Amphibalanus improvisus]|uniref:hypothetical protein n=1 Tax=Spiroplasma endosymbiont of Amphibalanus improvisus TaxID=3066327 RepID=UPI00313D788A